MLIQALAAINTVLWVVLLLLDINKENHRWVLMDIVIIALSLAKIGGAF